MENRIRITLEGGKIFRGSFHDRVGPSIELTVDDFQSQRASELGVDRVTRILRSKQPTSFESRLIGSIQWAGRATGEPRKEQAFLLYAIALESFLTGNIDRELAYRLRLRAAHLLGRTFEDRQRVIKRLRELYGVRSKVVHGGAYEVGDDDLRDIHSFAKGAILAVLCRNEFRALKTNKDLDEWFERTLVGGESAGTPVTG